MVDWRTLGEVPDSEDEDGFDSQSIEYPLPTKSIIQTTTTGHADGPIRSGRDDIWDVPSSPDAHDGFERYTNDFHRATEPQTETTKAAIEKPGDEQEPAARDSDEAIWEIPSSPPNRHVSASYGAGNSVDIQPTTLILEDDLPPQISDQLREVKDIWDLPSSQELGERQPQIQRPRLETRSPLPSTRLRQTTPPSQFFSSQDLPSIEQLVGRASDHAVHTLRPSQERDDTAVSKKITASSSPASALVPTNFSSAPIQPSIGVAQTPLQSQILGHDTEHEEARLLAAGYERSLRARKPEQIRPYATEMARFNRDWTKSGMRRLRLDNTEAERHRPEQVDSQEKDFEPESQGSNNYVEESQLKDSGGCQDGLMITRPSSSPLQTSPLDNKGAPSSQISSQAETEHTSLDDDDLPTIEQLSRRREYKSKRRRAPSKAAVPKRRRIANSFDTSPMRPAPPRLAARQDSPDPLGLPGSPYSSPIAEARRLPHRSPACEADPGTQRAAGLDIFDPFASDGESGAGGKEPPVHIVSDDGVNDSSDSSDGDSEAVNKNRGRIRGVLPASWLRIDQETGRKQLQKKFERPLERSPDREARRGVAQRRQADSRMPQDKFLFSGSDNETPPTTTHRTTNENFPNQARLALQSLSNPPAIDISSDDGGSIMEDDHIDRMASGRKRQMKLSDSFEKAAKRPKALHGTTAALPRKRNVESKVSRALSKPGGTSAGMENPLRKQRKKSKQGSHVRTQGPKRSRRQKAPQLSVLDVIEVNAPQFLKIAARTAKSRQDQGRTSPTKKQIQLATRQDHLDVAEVLGSWRRGSLRQRESVTTARTPRTRLQTQPELSATEPVSCSSRDSLFPRAAPRKLTKQVSNGGRVRYQGHNENARPTSPRLSLSRLSEFAFQPAQLQTEAAYFHLGKKKLDRLFRPGKRGASTGTSPVPPALTIGPTVLSTIPPVTMSAPVRRRKQKRPQRIDASAPQYSHANDPIGDAQPVLLESEIIAQHAEEAKLLGLGPYGTHYTHHFEVFPLMPGIYFHHSTLFGSGVLEIILHKDYSPRLEDPRPKAVFTLGEQTLRWGQWDAQVSSEIGVVFDYVSEQLERSSERDSLNMPTCVDAADHLLTYAKSCMTLESSDDGSSFLARCVEIVQSFINRLPADPAQVSRDLFQVWDRVCLFTFTALRICCSDPTLVSYQIQLENLVKSLAVFIAKLLAVTNSNQLTQTYGKLKNPRARGEGLRQDQFVIHTWALMLRILERASIAGGGFWDVVQEALLPGHLASCTNVVQLERSWEQLFILLPLTDFTDSGVVVAGGRQRAATDGWKMPQKLLKRVFQLYQDNPRQSPGFNSYCRGLVARCHYLVQHWGWRKSSSVVGTIFDFFGSQGLAHLRNEVFYQSPRFLEDLHCAPSLKVEPEDRCFHIFLKMLALSIRNLREDQSTKDIRNLVARTLPNHSRQYSKEQKIQERDLAALRNHHDLLATLYWAAPPDLRPNVDLLEKLVVPASSHKEACLINLRAWNQLARFVISTGEAQTSFGSFYQWRRSFFEKMLHQTNTVASDIQQQLAGVSEDVGKKISDDMVRSIVSMNKAGIMDMLHLSTAASLDVMRHAPDLQAAHYALDIVQLQDVFGAFAASPPEMDWAILRNALATLDTFLSHIEKFEEAQESQQSESQILNSALGDDALLLLYEHMAPRRNSLSKSYFKMARCVLASSAMTDTQVWDSMDRFDCTEQAIKLGAKLTVKFTGAGVMCLADLFKPGDHRLFEHAPHELGLQQRKFFALFIASLLQQGLDGCHDAEFTLQELYMLAIVKPQESLAYENRLAEQLIRHKMKFVPRNVVGLSIGPDYGTNRQLFEFAIDHMRKSVRDAGPSTRKDLMADNTKILRHVMAQIQSDLKTTVNERTQHPAYVSFVRSIVSLIKTHGPGIGVNTIDGFFFQVSKEYSPPPQDLQYSVAGMTAYGLRVIEGDTRVESELFYFLLNRFKLAMRDNKQGDTAHSNRMDDEARLLANGLQHPGILKFVLGSMLPAVVGAMARVSANVLVDVYIQALRPFLDGGNESFVLEEENLPQIKTTLGSILRVLCTQKTGSSNLANEEIHVLRQLFGLMNLLWPSIYVLVLRGSSSAGLEDVESLLNEVKKVTARAEIYLSEHVNMAVPMISRDEMLGSVSHGGPLDEEDSTISKLEDLIVADVRRTWVIDAHRITIQAHPSAAQSTQPARGIKRPVFDSVALVEDLYERVQEWNRWWNKAYGVPKQTVQLCEETLFF